MIFQKKLLLLVVVAVAGMLSVASSGSAHAFVESERAVKVSKTPQSIAIPDLAAAKRQARNTCYEGYVCLYKGPNLSGEMFLAYGNTNLAPVGFDNDIESFWNRTGSYRKLFENANCTGGFNGASSGEANTLAPAWRNRISSMCHP